MEQLSNKTIAARLESAERRLAGLEDISLRRFFLGRDWDGNLYWVPVDDKEEWNDLLQLIELGRAGCDEWGTWENKYGPRRLKQDLSRYSFVDFRFGHNPREEA